MLKKLGFCFNCKIKREGSQYSDIRHKYVSYLKKKLILILKLKVI